MEALHPGDRDYGTAFANTGSLGRDWALHLRTERGTPDYRPAAGLVTFSPDETFFVRLTDAINATILDGEGVGRVLRDEMGGAASDLPRAHEVGPQGAHDPVSLTRRARRVC